LDESSLKPREIIQPTCRVLADYRVSYPDPLVVSAGDELSVGKKDPEYPGWVWCTNSSGKGGWLPDDCIELAGENARYDYAATELSATVGEELVMSKEKSGWAWCTNRNGESGWLPLANLATGEL